MRGARPRTVPVLGRYHARPLAAARFAGTALVCGGADPGRRNITNPLTIALDGGTGLPRLDTGRLRATWLAEVAQRPASSPAQARPPPARQRNPAGHGARF